MAQQRIIFDGESFLRLLTTYYDGLIPMDAKLKSVGVSQFMTRWVCFWVDSEAWDASEERPNGEGLEDLHLRYEGRRNMSWSKADGDKPIEWGKEGEDFEVPR